MLRPGSTLARRGSFERGAYGCLANAERSAEWEAAEERDDARVHPPAPMTAQSGAACRCVSSWTKDRVHSYCAVCVRAQRGVQGGEGLGVMAEWAVLGSLQPMLPRQPSAGYFWHEQRSFICGYSSAFDSSSSMQGPHMRTNAAQMDIFRAIIESHYALAWCRRVGSTKRPGWNAHCARWRVNFQGCRALEWLGPCMKL